MKTNLIVTMMLASVIMTTSQSLLAETNRTPSQKTDNTQRVDNEQNISLFNNLLAVLEETTEIATKTKMNADYVPGILTVLRGHDLKTRGIQTVEEALLLVPGFTQSFNGINNSIVIRGFSKHLSGKIKILLNNISFNDTSTASGLAIPLIPIDMVDRIEIVRGPGAAVYGEYAFSGTIKIQLCHCYITAMIMEMVLEAVMLYLNQVIIM